MVKLKRLIRGFIYSLLTLTLILEVGIYFLLRDKYVPPILMYHKINEEYMKTKLSISPQSFERQMRFVREHYNPISLNQLVQLMREGKEIPRDAIVITFDDGYENNYTNAFPVLKKYRIPATIFLIVDKIDKPGYLNMKQIQEMLKSGLIEFGSHTLTHPYLTEIPKEEARREIFNSKAILESKLGQRIRLFSYPCGGFNEGIKRLVEEAGYIGAVATDPGEKFPNDDVYALKRVRISRSSDNIWVFWLYSSGYYTWIKEMRDEE